MIGNFEVKKSNASVNGNIEASSVTGHIRGHTVLGNARIGSIKITHIDSPFRIIYDTVDNWNEQSELIPDLGTVVVYVDKYSYEKDGETIYVPGIKIADGNAYLIDLPFVTDHIENSCLVYSADTVSGWSNNTAYIPKKNEIIIYTDKYSYEKDGEMIHVPGIKMGDGMSYAADLPFALDAIDDRLEKHIADDIRHITNEERTFWNNKLNCIVDGENLTLNRL